MHLSFTAATAYFRKAVCQPMGMARKAASSVQAKVDRGFVKRRGRLKGSRVSGIGCEGYAIPVGQRWTFY